ncbi:MAG: CHAT domain-containing protein [Candidatus Contendobacter sp.]|nr:CHAT domain-containing protein [Candidatus Contendobacter sp.]MDS4060394.1 CHAT domain-containing protein [Candidatus Contendobacter sp.]
MPTHFDLIVTADAPNHTAEFRLLDAHGSQLAYHHTDFKTITVGHQRGLFDLRDYFRVYVEKGKETAAIAEIGVCIAEEVLGQDIFEKLWASKSQRTLRIQLPGASEEENRLAAALARVPWEIARPKATAETLGERNLLVRVVHDMRAPISQPVELAPAEPLRVLFVFAEARGSRPLGARQERRELLRLFHKEIYPRRRVVAHFLTHGVTRERLIDQIQHNSGYHVLHWSGHGHLNLLELAKPGGAKDLLSGGELLDLFTDAGGFLPRLVFLSACHSGDILRVKDWKDFLAVAQGQEPGTKEAETKDLDLQVQPGFTGTAHALLHGGVPSVVAMRYVVSDNYARELAVEFYRALLAHPQPKNAAAALTLARNALLDDKKYGSARFDTCDHATPVLYGTEQPGLTPAPGRSPETNPRNPRLHSIAELTTTSHEHFVGRTWELASLGADFIGSSAGAEVKPVAVITGLGGMGKTALVAEALALWETRFDWVLLYQAKPNALGFDATLRDIDLKLRGELGRYHDHVKARPADAIYRDASAEFTGPARLERLTQNLIRALQDEAILLVLDNFETNLKPQPEPSPVAGQPVWACQDPAWDHCLKALASELAGSPSRVLITSRRPLAALVGGGSYPLLLGPLPPAEAALYLKAHPALSRMVFGADAQEKLLAQRLLNASRFHPLLMDRLARLAADAKLRPQLLQTLDTLEKTGDFAQLPALFATTPGDATELAYLNDALIASLDQLIRNTGSATRRLLWMIAVANEPVALGLLESVWGGESLEQQQLRQIKQMLDDLPKLPPELQKQLKAMPPEIRVQLDALPPALPPRPELQPLLRHLVSVGLVTEERDGPDDANPDLTCHEVVRERIHAWMEQQPQDRSEWTENAIRLAYAERLRAVYDVLQHQNMTAALQAGSRALVYCVQAEAWDRLGSFASDVVTSTQDPRLLDGLIPHLQTAAESAPEGRPRWSCLGYLADALRLGGRPDASLRFYEQAATLARATAEAGGESAQQAWSDLAAITGNWANALGDVGHLDAARQRQLEAAEIKKQTGRSQVDVIGSELEALRIDVMQGQVKAALPQIEARLVRVAAWWQQQCAGQPVPEAPYAEIARAYISALDIARQADYARQDWASALHRIDAVLEVKRALQRPAEDIARDRVNRANVLGRLGRFGEARAELEACLPLFQNDPAASSTVLSSLADLFDKQGDVAQAITQERRALALCEQLPDPTDRAVSHHNLANHLEHHGAPAALAESSRHRLADLIYCLVAGLGQHLQTSRHNYAVHFRRAHVASAELAVPRVAELLADPAFYPLDQWLHQRQVDMDELQAEVDQVLEQVRQAALEQP